MKVNATDIGSAKKTGTKNPQALEAPEVEIPAAKTKAITLTVSRKKWRRDALADSKGRMCIMGQYLNQVGGVPERDMVGYGDPRTFIARLPIDMHWIAKRDNNDLPVSGSDLQRAIGVNDSSDRDREFILKEIFKRHNVELEFVD